MCNVVEDSVQKHLFLGLIGLLGFERSTKCLVTIQSLVDRTVFGRILAIVAEYQKRTGPHQNQTHPDDGMKRLKPMTIQSNLTQNLIHFIDGCDSDKFHIL